MMEFFIDHPFIPAAACALALLYLIVRVLNWTEGPTPDYDDSENGVGWPL